MLAKQSLRHATPPHRVKGRNVEENQYIKMGAYHTVDLEANQKFTLFKEHWDSVTLERVDNACDPARVSASPRRAYFCHRIVFCVVVDVERFLYLRALVHNFSCL